MSILLAYRLHKGNRELEGILPQLRTELRGLEDTFGEVRECSNFDPLGFQNLDTSGLYVPLIYSSDCLTGKYHERRFEREFDYFSKKGVSSLIIGKEGLNIPSFKVLKPSISQTIYFSNEKDLVQSLEGFISQFNPRVLERKVA